MSAIPNWLQSLEQATNYRELQTAFDLMWAEVNSARVDSSRTDMIDKIDEAIRRIEQERTRDQAELAEFNDQYAAFKDQNSGVIGWFKRKMPFTATRKQDVELRESMRDQEAEILADNFVIALSQMLKESLVPPTAARCGLPAQLYRDQLAAHDSVSGLRDFGKVVLQISRELPIAEQFIAQLQSDIDAFAAAKFSDKDDTNLKKAGLEKAEQAISSLVRKVDDKKSLVSAAEERLRKLVEQDLAEQDPAFRTLQQHLHQLNDFIKKGEQTGPILEERTQLIGKIKNKVNDLNKIPERIDAVHQKLAHAQTALRTAQSALRQAETAAQPIQQRYEAARQAADQARVRLEATQPLVQAYLTEQGLDLSATADQACVSPVCAEYESLKAAAETGREQLQQITAQYESTSRQVKQHHADVDKLTKDCNDQQQELNQLKQNLETQQRELTALCDRYRMEKHAFESSVKNWIAARAALNWHPQLSSGQTLPGELTEDLFAPNLVNASTSKSHASAPVFNRPTSSGVTNQGLGFGAPHTLSSIEETLKRFVTEFTQATTNSQKTQQQLTQDQDRALRQRSRILLDGELAAKIFPDR